MIPVLICPVVSRFDLFERMVRSIDEPVERVVLVDNSCTNYVSFGALAKRIRYIRPMLGLGYPGGINAGIAQTPDAPWWLFASADIEWGPGDLAEIAAEMDADPEACVVTGDRRDSRLLRWAYGALNRATVEAVGLMDEWSFYPIYFDDDDYERRCRLGGVEWIEFNGDIRHGESGTKGSVTIADPVHHSRNQTTYPMNARRYVEKWGGLPGEEKYPTPWNLPVPLSFTRPDPAGRAARIW